MAVRIGRTLVDESLRRRNEAIKKAFTAGETYEKIGARHRISRERVRQILRSMGDIPGGPVERRPFTKAQEERIRDIIAGAIFDFVPEVKAINLPSVDRGTDALRALLRQQKKGAVATISASGEAVAPQGHLVADVSIRILPDGRVSRADAANFLGLAVGTLSNWASRGQGPRTVTVGGRIFYYLRDLEAFRDTGAREAPWPAH